MSLSRVLFTGTGGPFGIMDDAAEGRAMAARVTARSPSLCRGRTGAIPLERESMRRQRQRIESRAKAAKLRHLAAVEDVDYRMPRRLDRAMLLKLTRCDRIRE